MKSSPWKPHESLITKVIKCCKNKYLSLYLCHGIFLYNKEGERGWVFYWGTDQIIFIGKDMSRKGQRESQRVFIDPLLFPQGLINSRPSTQSITGTSISRSDKVPGISQTQTQTGVTLLHFSMDSAMCRGDEVRLQECRPLSFNANCDNTEGE